MLIRLMSHYPENPQHIDKLIAIKGLPEEWFFRKVDRTIDGVHYVGKELILPWLPEIEANVPSNLRHLCEPMEVLRVFPPIHPGQPSVVDKSTIIGVRFDFMSNPGQEAWEKIERFLDRMTPRDMPVPKPVMVAPDHKSAFDPHAARRSVRGSLEIYRSEIPNVDLRIIPSVEVMPTATMQPTLVTTTAVGIPPVVVASPVMAKPSNADIKPTGETYSCEQCPKVFDKKQALKMHVTVKHKIKEPVGV